MGEATQKDRLLSIATKLPFDTLLLDWFECEEGISELFTINVELLREEDDETPLQFTPVDVKSILGQRASIRIEQPDDADRYFTGIFINFRLIGRQTRYTRYAATIVPNAWRLTQNFKSRIFQHISVPDILREVFDGFDVKFSLTRSYKKRHYCVQYQETDFDFASRIMAEEGIYFYFEHKAEAETIVFKDDYKSPEDCPAKSRLGMFDIDVAGTEVWESSVQKLWVEHVLTAGKYVAWDYNFQLPSKRLNVETRSRENIGGNQDMEIYQFPGGYAHKYDGIDKTGGEQPGELDQIFKDNDTMAKNRMLVQDTGRSHIRGSSDCCSMIAGYRFTIANHPNSELNKPYILTRVRHEASQNPGYIVGDPTVRKAYSNEFECIPHGTGEPEFRPVSKAQKPFIPGSQTAFVVGPSGEEIFTDKYGRIKVQFPWDRDGEFDAGSSCWVRVAQTWASNKWGSMFIPRVGMEVIVQFVGGDPDQPIVTGCVYNPEAMPAYDLPDNKTRSGIKSNSTKGGGGFNEFRIEDKKGEEQIFVHAEKNLDVRVKNDTMETVENDRHLLVKNDQKESVTKDKHLSVGGDKSEAVKGTVSLKVDRDLQEKVGINYALDAGMEVHIKSGMNLMIESGTTLSLKVGGNFININSAGIFIKGTMVMINSGGAAGSGSGSNPSAPASPKEADTDKAGQAAKKQSNPPPPAPAKPKALAQAMWNAAASGTPFVAV